MYAPTHVGYPGVGELLRGGTVSSSGVHEHEAAFKKIPRWYGHGDCVRSSFCEMANAMGTGRCWPCEQVLTDRSYTDFNGVQSAGEVSNRCRLDILPVEVLYEYAAKTLRDQHQAHFYELSSVRSELRRNRVELEYVKSKLLARISSRKPKFMVYLDRAIEMGLFEDDNQLLEDVLNGLAVALVEGRRKRKLSDNEKSFYATVLSYGGERVHNLVSQAFLGPHVSVSKKVRSAYYAYEYGRVVAQIVHARVRLEQYGLMKKEGGENGTWKSCPCLIGEDGSALVKRIDVVKEKANGVERVMAYGANGGPFEVESVEQMADKVREKQLATTLYAWVLIPIVEGAPHIPLMVECHNNAKEYITKDKVAENWEWLWRVCEKAGICVVGHCYDGDKRCVGAGLELMCGDARNKPSASDLCFSDVPMLAHFRCPLLGGGYKIFFVDCLHTCWRLRVQYLNPTRKFWICGLWAESRHLKTFEERHRVSLLPPGDYDYHDKVNWYGFLRLAGFIVKHGKLKGRSDLVEKLGREREYAGDVLYLTLLNKYATLWWVKGQSIRELVSGAVWCISLVMAWDMSIKDYKDKEKQPYTLKENFLTRETANHVIQSCTALLLTCLLFKRNFVEYDVVPSRLTSRFNEYLFAFLRTDIKGQTKFSAHAALWHLKHYDCQLHVEGTSDVRGVDGKRGVPSAIGKITYTRPQWPVAADGESLEQWVKDSLDETMKDFSEWGKDVLEGGSVEGGLLGKIEGGERTLRNTSCLRAKDERLYRCDIEEVEDDPGIMNQVPPWGGDDDEDERGDEGDQVELDEEVGLLQGDGQRVAGLRTKKGAEGQVDNRQEGDVLSSKLDEITGKVDTDEGLFEKACAVARHVNSEYVAQRLGTHDKFQGTHICSHGFPLCSHMFPQCSHVFPCVPIMFP